MKTTELLSALNVLRVRAGKPALKAWKESRAKLQAAYDLLNAKDIADFEKHDERKATDKAKVDRMYAPRKSATEKASPKVVVNEMSARQSDFAEWCRQNNVNPKVARARLRKAGIEKVNGRYDLNKKTCAVAKGE